MCIRDRLREELQFSINGINTYRPMLDRVGEGSIPKTLLPTDLEDKIRSLLIGNLEKFGYPAPAKVRGRRLFPKGLLLRISTAGVYIPFTGEGHIDAGLHHLQLPFVMAHEMSHATASGEKGTVIFWPIWLACSRMILT